MRASLSLAVGLGLSVGSSSNVVMGSEIDDGSVPATHLYSGSTLVATRDELLHNPNSTSVLTTALKLVNHYAREAATKTEIYSVINKTLTLPGVSPHNYISIGIYNHPCNALPKDCTNYPGSKPYPPQPFPSSMCDNKTGMPWYPCDGETNPSAIEAGDSPRQSEMNDQIQLLAMAAFYAANGTASAPFVKRAVDVAQAWFLTNETKMLPNLYYGQIHPTSTPPPKGHGGFIEVSLGDIMPRMTMQDSSSGRAE